MLPWQIRALLQWKLQGSPLLLPIMCRPPGEKLPDPVAHTPYHGS